MPRSALYLCPVHICSGWKFTRVELTSTEPCFVLELKRAKRRTRGNRRPRSGGREYKGSLRYPKLSAFSSQCRCRLRLPIRVPAPQCGRKNSSESCCWGMTSVTSVFTYSPVDQSREHSTLVR
ncbi:hypothetical protein PISMIDRAFT_222893 [Pisolithus microcarpus 441]|uniref:Uncharacterized protein n=1 Tax=Pisolithus microcarpus 441 TaxID=765257 RepID=A0A0C9Z554_9AGAM|nr:hypothetical protein PISMIDRAFT_222893 [Pisolithus microcarpus 441]